MEPLSLSGLPVGATLFLDSAPIIYVLEDHRQYASRYRPLFEAHDAGDVRFAISAVTIAEILTGPFRAQDESLARRYRAVLESWQVVVMDPGIAETTARLRAGLRLKLGDAIQAASALAINAAALVTHDRDFSRVKSLRVMT
jgi:predicted nucleic acid-binding protein